MEDIVFSPGADLFRTAYERVSVGICIVTEDHRLACANPAFCRMLNLCEAELIRLPISSLLHPEDRHAADQLFKRVLETGLEQSLEIRCFPGGGDIMDAEARFSISDRKDASDRRLVVVTLLDITDRRRAEKTLLDNISRLAKAQAVGHLGSWELDLGSGMVYASEEALRMMGAEDQTLRVPMDMVMHGICPDDQNRLRHELGRLSELGGVLDMECCVKTDGAPGRRVVRIHGVAERDREGQTTRLLGVLQDVTALRFMEEDLQNTEKQFRQIYEQAPIGIALVEAGTGKIRHANRKFAQLLGRGEEEIWELDWKGIVHPEDRAAVLALMDSWSGGENTDRQIGVRYLKPDGGWVWTRNTVTDIRAGDGDADLRLCMVEDASECVRAEMALRKSEAKHKAMVANISEVLSIIGGEDRFTYISPNIEERFGWRPEDLLGEPIWTVVRKKDGARVRRWLQKLSGETGSRSTEQFDYLCRDGSVRAVEITGVNLEDDGNIGGVLLNYRDVTERKKREEVIFHLSYHDSLTGLYNRAYFDSEKTRLDAGRYLPLSVIIGDVNGLKLINDAFGHAEGDKLLAAVGKVLRKCTRRGDIVTRNGGDEFAVLLPRTGRDAAMKIMDRIENLCAESMTMVNRETYFLSISLGCATKEREEQDFDGVVNTAEEMMYKKKLQEHDELHDSILNSVRSTMYERGCETEAHGQRLAALTRTLGRAMGLDDAQLDALRLLSELHDVGQISVEEEILRKPGKLTEREWCRLRKHPEAGCRIALAAPGLKHIAGYILCHHERWDGTGYPKGLAGEEIPLLSRILAVADAYDAMTQDKPYRKAMPREKALEELRVNAGRQFDPAVVLRFLTMEKQREEDGWSEKAASRRPPEKQKR